MLCFKNNFTLSFSFLKSTVKQSVCQGIKKRMDKRFFSIHLILES